MWGEVVPLVVTGAIGAGLLAAYLRDVAHVLRLWRNGIRTSGVVVGNAETNAESGTRWEPVVAFADRNGTPVTGKPIVRSDVRMQPGEEVPVVYMAHRPETMLLHTRRSMARALLENSMLLFLGTLFLGFPLAFALV